MAQGVDVGDAVLKFIGDTTDVDAAYAKINNTGQVIAPAGRAVEDFGGKLSGAGRAGTRAGSEIHEGMRKAGYSAKEAKGEIGLLGEATGVHLPRHVRSFVAELPGVGKALTAAFSATAVLFVIEAIVQATEKLTEWISENFIFTESMKESNKIVAEGNKKLLEYAAELKKLKEEYLLIGLQGVAKYNEQMVILNGNIDAQKKKVVELREEVTRLAHSHDEEIRAIHRGQGIMERYWDGFLSLIHAQTHAETELQKKQAEKEQAYVEAANKEKVLEQQKKNLHKETAMAIDDETEKLYERGKVIQNKLNHEIEQLRQAEKEYAKLGYASVKASEMQIDMVPMIVQDLEQWSKALRDLGVTGVGELSRRVEDERRAVAGLEVLLATKHIGTLGDVHRAKLRLIQDEIKLAQATGKNTKELEKQEKQLKKQIPEFQQYGKVATSVANAVGHAVTQTAFAYGQGAITISQALRQVTAAIISEVAKQAEVEGAKNLAKAFSDLGDYDFSAAGHHFAAATAWFALGGGISMAAGAFAGGSATPGTAANPVNVTGTAGAATGGPPKPVGGVNVQAFASGGLVTKPTLALMAEKPGTKGELAIPLDDPQAKQHIRDAVGGGHGDGNIIVNVQGMISGDNLGKVIQKINQRVKKGQSSLTASNSHRITRRSV